ncbi:MAG: class I SAM-dependent methyltransferase [Candidatus Aminicenantes bacterium]|nr:class I SAM-dependent methyltransferase [Candidatus Aminicenantes bacterium]
MFFSVKLPFQDHEVADYERRRYRGFDQRWVHGREVRILRKALRIIRDEEPDRSPDLALDAPCGYGRFSAFLIDAGYRPVSCDLSPAMVRRARAKDSIFPAPMGIVGDLTRGLPVRAGAFPLVFSLRFFHHLHQREERRAALQEFARSSGGWLILSFYQANPLHRAQRALRRRIKKSRTRIKMISSQEFREEAADAGFRVVRIFPLIRGIHAQHIALLKKG